jgi:hypothetical protein
MGAEDPNTYDERFAVRPKLEQNLRESVETTDWKDHLGDELPVATVRRIVTAVVAQVDSTVRVKVSSSPEGYYLVSTDNGKLRFDFGITASYDFDNNTSSIDCNVENGYSSYKGAGVIQMIIGLCFAAGVRRWGKPDEFTLSVYEDRGDGAWQHIAQKLGAKWVGSVR